MSERRPRRRDFDSTARYYTVLLGWLEHRYDDQVDRARKFHKITQKEDGMPVKRPEKAHVETPLERRVRDEMDEMFDRAGVGPKALAAEQRRIHKLVRQEVNDELTPNERAELDRLILTQMRRKQRSERFAAAVDARQAKHPDESRDEALLAVALEQSAKRDRRDAKKDKRRKKAERAATTAPARRTFVTPTEPRTATLTEPAEATPKRRRIRARIDTIPFNQ